VDLVEQLLPLLPDRLGLGVKFLHSRFGLFPHGRDLFLEPLQPLRRLRARAAEGILRLGGCAGDDLVRLGPRASDDVARLGPCPGDDLLRLGSCRPCAGDVLFRLGSCASDLLFCSSRALAVISSAVSRACCRRAFACSPTRSSARLTAACGDRPTSSSAIRRLT